MKKLILHTFYGIVLSSNLFSQTGGGTGNLNNLFKNLTIIGGINQSLYDKEWNKNIDSLSNISQEPYRKFNFGLIKEFDTGALIGIKAMTYGYELRNSDLMDDDMIRYTSKLELEIKFLKGFFTFPITNGFYLGLEGGYFSEGKLRQSISGGNSSDYSTIDLDRDSWDDADLSDTEWGILAQYYHNLQSNFLLLAEGYYGLSRYNDDYTYDEVEIPMVFYYLNIGIAYKFKKKNSD